MTTTREILTSPVEGVTGQEYVPVNHLGVVPTDKRLHTWDCPHWYRKTTPELDPYPMGDRSEKVSYVCHATPQELRSMLRCATCGSAPSASDPATEVQACPKCFTVHPAGDCY
ncbi:hypothetical protein E8D34_08735 [Nocardioides sp. GY 10113]|uniref:hypothetical protein n=1 Tax=Nocardioides sp. GY 10113 TaxID=2569761 RepID=UPI0010A89BB8|nr:hypothetical protein [Nocardioides sp. GY 10113]TIC87749.1 hypothetical protein E8D34_08735 [Nocardioides sp. GY 10113]